MAWSLFQRMRSLGQNFLLDDTLQRRIVAEADVRRGDAVVEVGPGLGSLTRHLAATGASVVAVEKDDALHAHLCKTLEGTGVALTHGDVLQQDLAQLAAQAGRGAGPTGRTLLVANLPYNITQSFLLRALPLGASVHAATLLLQEEAAERLVHARPGDHDWRAMNLLVHYYSRASIRCIIPRAAFAPPPKVNGALVHLRLLAPSQRLAVPSEAAFLSLTRAAFSQRRKMLRNVLAPRWDPTCVAAALDGLSLDRGIRAERLTLQHMVDLCWALEQEQV